MEGVTTEASCSTESNGRTKDSRIGRKRPEKMNENADFSHKKAKYTVSEEEAKKRSVDLLNEIHSKFNGLMAEWIEDERKVVTEHTNMSTVTLEKLHQMKGDLYRYDEICFVVNEQQKFTLQRSQLWLETPGSALSAFVFDQLTKRGWLKNKSCEKVKDFTQRIINYLKDDTAKMCPLELVTIFSQILG